MTPSPASTLAGLELLERGGMAPVAEFRARALAILDEQPNATAKRGSMNRRALATRVVSACHRVEQLQDTNDRAALVGAAVALGQLVGLLFGEAERQAARARRERPAARDPLRQRVAEVMAARRRCHDEGFRPFLARWLNEKRLDGLEIREVRGGRLKITDTQAPAMREWSGETPTSKPSDSKTYAVATLSKMYALSAPQARAG
jgi:hypothetical protein